MVISLKYRGLHMSTQVIPQGSSVVITDDERNYQEREIEKTLHRMSDVVSKDFSDANSDRSHIARDLVQNVTFTRQDVVAAITAATAGLTNQINSVDKDVTAASTAVQVQGANINAVSATNFATTLASLNQMAASQALAAAKIELEIERSSNKTREEVGVALKDSTTLAYQNHIAVLGEFKNVAAKQAECCCEMKSQIESVKGLIKQEKIEDLRQEVLANKLLGRRFKTFSPAPTGTLLASDED
jgi:hypothetical protein